MIDPAYAACRTKQWTARPRCPDKAVRHGSWMEFSEGTTGCAAVGLALLHGTGLEDRNRGKSNTSTKNRILAQNTGADCLVSGAMYMPKVKWIRQDGGVSCCI